MDDVKKDYIVILDDEENILNSLKRLLRQEPYSVFITTDYMEAIKAVGELNAKLVLSDYKMPDITGVDFLEIIKTQYPDVVRVLFTGYLDVHVAEEAINKSGVYRFVNKPWVEEDLKSALRQGIDRFNLNESNRLLSEETRKKNEELTQANEKLQAMYDVQKDFTSTVSHELRTPLASIKMAIDILETETPGALTDDQKNFLNKAKVNIDRLNRLINDILDLTKMETGKMQMNLSSGDLNKQIEGVADCQKYVAQQKGIELKIELDENIPLIFFDSDRIDQVLNNLISNAIKFTEKGEIILSTKMKKEDNLIEVCVKDSGKGIAEEDMPKLFKKFQQLGNPTDQVSGTGLGLAICQTIMEMHKGKIWAESVLNEGTRFYFTIPIMTEGGK